jgi:hypothetical protein
MNALFSLSALGLLSLLTASAAHAQTFEGYTAVGNGRYSNQFASGKMGPTIAAGADVFFAPRFSVEGEVGLDEFFPTVSLDGMVQLRTRASARVVPFIRAGFTYTNAEYSASYNGPNVGGGVILWLRPRTGLRVEYLHVVQNAFGWTENHDLGRVGVSFR